MGLLKNINISPSYRPKLTSETHICPYMGIRFSAITLPFFDQSSGKWAWPPRRRHMVFGLQTQPKSWLTGYTFWVNHYLEIVFSKISVYPIESFGTFVIDYHINVQVQKNLHYFLFWELKVLKLKVGQNWEIS